MKRADLMGLTNRAAIRPSRADCAEEAQRATAALLKRWLENENCYYCSLDYVFPTYNDIVKLAGRHSKMHNFNAYSLYKKKIQNVLIPQINWFRLPLLERASIFFRWRLEHRMFDPDNAAAAKKFVLDSLVVAHVLPKDSPRHVVTFCDDFVYGVKTSGVDLLLIPEGPE